MLIRNVGAQFDDLGFGNVNKRKGLEPVLRGKKSLEHPGMIETQMRSRSGSGSSHFERYLEVR
jgi:hypothetical protein